MTGSRRRRTHHLTVVVLLLAMGLASILMQTVAWTDMLVDYTRSNGLGAAIAMTFDGSHPCVRCKEIQKDEQEQQQRKALIHTTDILLFHEDPRVTLAPVENPLRRQSRDHESIKPLTRTQKPPVPPPRARV